MTASKDFSKSVRFMLHALKRRNLKIQRDHKSNLGIVRCYGISGTILLAKRAIKFGPGYFVEIEGCVACRHHESCPNRREYVIVPTRETVPTANVVVCFEHDLYYARFLPATTIPVE